MSLILPFKFLELKRRFGTRSFSMLDVGSGNHSARLAKQWFPACRYTGIDLTRDYNNDAEDFACMEEFFELDLTTLDFRRIPDLAYDVILMAHVVEHLLNGDQVIRGLIPKLRPGGVLYVEYPGPRSLRLPSRPGCLNFHDDPTHVRMYSLAEITGLLRRAGLEIVEAGTRRDARAIALLPLRALKSKLDHGYVAGGVFWDLLGFAEYVIAHKPAGLAAGEPAKDLPTTVDPRTRNARRP